MGVVAHGAPVFKIGGDPGGISTRAAVMMDRANEFGEIHSGLSSLKSDGWEGRAADHFRSKFKVQTKGWLDAQEAFSSASEAYSSYASTLASAQGQCDGIRSRWKQGRDAVQQAQNNQADARSQAAAEGGIPMFDASCDEGPGRSAMAAAVADFETLVDQVNEAGDLLITALNAGIAKLPERTWWDSVKRTVGSVVKGFVEAVADLVKLGLALSGVPMLFDFGRMLMGQMTWDEFYAKHSTIPMETIAGLAKALWEDPGAFFAGLGKALVDWDTWTDDPGRAIGHLLPDVLIAIATAGTGTAASAGEKATSGAARLARMAHIGKEVFKAVLPVNPDDVRALGKLGKNLFTKFTHHGVDAADTVAKLSADARRQVSGLRGGNLMADANKYSDAGHLSGNASHGANNLAGLDHLSGRSSHVGGGAHDLAGASDLAGDASHAGRGTHNGGLSSTGTPDPGHRSNGVSSAAQPAATPHASAAGDAGTSGHAAPANTAPSASHGAHNNAFMNADTGGATHGAGSTANGATSAPAPGAPATGTHGAGATGAPGAPAPGAPGAPAGGSHGVASGHGPAGGSPAAPVRNEGVGERVATGDAIPPKKPTDSYRVGHDRSMTPDEVGSQSAAAADGKPPWKPTDSWDSDGLSTNRDDFDRVGTDRFGTANRMNSSYLDDSSTHANGQTRGADELVGAGVGRREASVGAQGSYERAGAFGGSDPSRVSHGADGFGGTADVAGNAGHAGHGANGVTNSADVGGGIGDASRGTHATGAPTGQGGGHVGADSGTHGGSSTPAQGPHRADPGMSTGDTHGVSRADSTPGHGDTPRTGQGGDGTPDAPTSPKKETPAGDTLGGDKQPHSGSPAADTPATHADEAADAGKAGHGSGDAHGSGKADADAQQGHDSAERADADPKAKDHSANGKADDTADSAHRGDKTEADKPASDKSHKEDDAAHHYAEHPKDTDDKHNTKNDDADSKSTKDEADTHKSDKDSDAKSDKGSAEHADAAPKAKDHSANGKADDAADSAHRGDKSETNKADDAAHHDGDERPKDADTKTDKEDDADTKSDKDAAPKAKDHSANGKADDAADSTRHGDKTEADKPTSDKSHKEDDAAHHDDDSKSDKDDTDGKSDKDKDHHESENDEDGSGTLRDATDSSADSVEDQPHINPESLAVFPKDYPTLNHIDSAPLNMRPIDDIPELLEHPERMEPPTTIEELVERSPHRPEEPEWDNHELKDVGLGDKYKTAADITVNPRGQLSDGTHPEMKSTADWTRSRYYDPESGRSVWRTDTDFGAVPGTKRAYTDIEALRHDFRIDGLDRTSHVGGSFMAPIIDDVIIPNEYRGTPITSIHEPYRQYDFNVNVLPDGYKAEISIAAPEQGSLGGTPQIQVLQHQIDGTWKPMSIADMLDADIIKGVTEHVGKPQIPDFEAIKRLFDHKN